MKNLKEKVTKHLWGQANERVYWQTSTRAHKRHPNVQGRLLRERLSERVQVRVRVQVCRQIELNDQP